MPAKQEKLSAAITILMLAVLVTMVALYPLRAPLPSVLASPTVLADMAEGGQGLLENTDGDNHRCLRW